MAKIGKIHQNKNSVDKKPKVWFCAHPNDYNVYLDEICKDLFSVQECIIYFDEEPTAEYNKEELFSNLQEINLFVMPVTKKLLQSDCRALSVEFIFARQNGIPVLPIMIDSGIEEEFSNKCGNLHLIKKSDESYIDKLKNYLSRVFIGNKLIEEIRREFDKRIFLSYRKIDKDKALQLIRLIRKIDFCRDVAIWYDEYLTAGEDFNDEIKKVLLNSDLFVLAITENITQKRVNSDGRMIDNYVVSDEFPFARDNKKTILPLRMAEVSSKRLTCFKNIPAYVNAYNEHALAKALINGLGKDIVKKKNNDCRHEYLIGLAYLEGIDVEVDRERAFSLIQNAANAGELRAIEKLVSMYRNGEAVEINYYKAIEWQRRLLEEYKKKLNSNINNLLYAEYYFNNLFTLLDYLTEAGISDEKRDVCVEGLPIAQQHYEAYPIFCTRRYIAMLYSWLAEYYLEKNNFNESLNNAYISLKIREENAEENHYKGLCMDDLISIYSLLNRIYYTKGDYESTKIYRDKCAALLTGAEERCESDEELALLLMRSSSAKSGIEKRDALERAFEIFDRLCSKERSINNLRNLALCYHLLATLTSSEARYYATSIHAPSIVNEGFKKQIKEKYGEDYEMADKESLMAQAKELEKKSVEIKEEIARLTRSAGDLRHLAKSYGEMGLHIFDMIKMLPLKLTKENHLAQYEEGSGYLARATEILEDMVRLYDLAEDRRDLAWYMSQRAFYVCETVVIGPLNASSCKQSVAFANISIEIYEKLIEESNSERDKAELSNIYGIAEWACELLSDFEMKEYYAKKKNALIK